MGDTFLADISAARSTISHVVFSETELLARLEDMFLSEARDEFESNTAPDHAVERIVLPSGKIRLLLANLTLSTSGLPLQAERMSTLLDEVLPAHEEAFLDASTVLQRLLTRWHISGGEQAMCLTQEYGEEINPPPMKDDICSDHFSAMQRTFKDIDNAISDLDSKAYDIALRMSEQEDQIKAGYNAAKIGLKKVNAEATIHRAELDVLQSSSGALDERVLKLESTTRSLLKAMKYFYGRLEELIHEIKMQLNDCMTSCPSTSVSDSVALTDQNTIVDVAQLADLLDQYIIMGRNLELLAEKIRSHTASPSEPHLCHEVQECSKLQIENGESRDQEPMLQALSSHENIGQHRLLDQRISASRLRIMAGGLILFMALYILNVIKSLQSSKRAIAKEGFTLS
ncbi:uncharacterized protein LAESUDRAFT_718645 [Laetiporus sulphureus 93-53]|uniref:Uncharacterized protein n=1 Tax=Laetiporus sulphureus 93-53 TaxID=1314785 RepID=A0A165AR07_9APHY|nr:uncharacterized protein LAESUDRAFT_718645 [Laetiporus sulphureus 93-53]KZS99489.1 hypothetical protein LAESUDRAFT_718645 [Laetiporus sulphureus 93-53]